LLLSINDTLALGLSEDKVSWKTVDETAIKQQKTSHALTALRALNGESWFQEMKEYRNFAHRGQLMLIADVGESGVNACKLAPIAEGAQQVVDVPTQLSGYFTEMQNFMSAHGFWP